MFKENSLAVYKNKPALVKEAAGGKILIALVDGETLKVRDKDIELIHPGPVKDLSGLGAGGAKPESVSVAW
jgi:exoribonuclease-2